MDMFGVFDCTKTGIYHITLSDKNARPERNYQY